MAIFPLSGSEISTKNPRLKEVPKRNEARIYLFWYGDY